MKVGILTAKGHLAAMTPLISVIMPVRNGQEWLRDAVGSVLSQHFGDFELVIVNDGSADGSANILDGIARTDIRVRVIHQSPQGLVAALNRAIATARAPFLARLDADDRARPDRFNKQLAFMRVHPEIGLLGSWAEKLDQAGVVIGAIRPATDGVTLARLLERGNPFVHSSVMMRADLVQRVGGYRTAFLAAEDYDLWLRLAEAGGVANIPEALVQYRAHEAGVTGRDAIRQSFSVRLAQRAAAARRGGQGDVAAALVAPPDWWATASETTFFADDVGFYRFLDAAPAQAVNHLTAVRRRLFALNHVERKLAQMRLHALLRHFEAPGATSRIRMMMLFALLHPARACSLAWQRPLR